MKSGETSKELYKQLRAVPWPQLWTEEVARFDRASPRERFERVSVIRAVGVVFSESGPADQKEVVRQWLLRLLQDPEEKIRRYAMAALPKIGVGASEEAELLARLPTATSEREGQFLRETLGKIGGTATFQAMEEAGGFSPQTVQRVRANVARNQSPSAIRLDHVISDFEGLRIHLRGRRGLEGIMRDEVEEQEKFRVVKVDRGLVVIAPLAPFALADIFVLRCFGTVGLVLDLVKRSSPSETLEALAAAIASPLSRRLLESLTKGSIRYRLEFIAKGNPADAVRLVANRAYALCPEILNDPREAPWAIDVHSTAMGDSVELRPRLTPDPRHRYRLDDVPAASHPPLAACMARLVGRVANERVWDPFCGSGLELIERTLRGGVRRVYGTDLSEEAVGITERNFAAAQFDSVEARFTCCDFRDFARIQGLGPNSLSLLITNPPLGRRVPIPDLRGLFDDLFAVAAKILQPGGRLVFTNPFQMESPQPSLQLESRRVVDMGGFDCRLEVYRKTAR